MLAPISISWNIGLGSLIRLQSRMAQLQSRMAQLQPSNSLPGAAEPAAKMAYSYGCWQEASVPGHIASSTDLLVTDALTPIR